MAWRLMWLPDDVETKSLIGSPVSFLSDEAMADAEMRTLIRQLRAEGINCISVAGTGVGQILRGSELSQWLDRVEIKSDKAARRRRRIALCVDSEPAGGHPASPSLVPCDHGFPRSSDAVGEHFMPKVLIAEDDLMIADMAEEVLLGHGYEVCGIARTVADAVALGLRHKPDFALIDLRLADGEFGTEIAAQLKGIGLGVLYATGNMSQVVLTAANGHACLAKPYRGADLLRGLKIVSDIVATGAAVPPFPRGFQVLRSEPASVGEFPYG